MLILVSSSTNFTFQSAKCSLCVVLGETPTDAKWAGELKRVYGLRGGNISLLYEKYCLWKIFLPTLVNTRPINKDMVIQYKYLCIIFSFIQNTLSVSRH